MATIWPWTDNLFLGWDARTKAVIKAPSAHLGNISSLSDIVIKYLLGSIFALSNIESFLDLFGGFEPSVKVGCVWCSQLGIVYSRGMGSVIDLTG